MKWGPLPGVAPQVILALEREVYEPVDQAGRFVIAVQREAVASTATCEAHWTLAKDGKKIAANKGSLAEGMLVVDFPLEGMEPGIYQLTAEVLDGGNKLGGQERIFEVRANSTPPSPKQARIPLLVAGGVPVTPHGYPLTFGVPIPRGALTDLTQARVVDAQGQPVPAQFTPRSYWGYAPAAGVRWLGVDIQSPQAAAWWPDRQATPYFLEYGPGIKNSVPKQSVRTQEVPGGMQVDTGPLKFLVRSNGFNLIDQVMLNGRPVLDQKGGGGAYLIDQEGATYRAAGDQEPSVTIEEAGPLRTVIRAEGWYIKEGSPGEEMNYALPTDKLCRFITRIEAYAGLPWVRVLHTWINTSDSFSVFFQDVGLSLIRPGNASARFGVEGAKPVDAPVGKGVYLLQDLPEHFTVCREDGKELASGRHSDGSVLAVAADGNVLAVSHRETWQRFPKEMEVLPGELRFHVWPAHGIDHPEIKPYAKDRYHQLWFAHQGKLLDLRFPWRAMFSAMRMEDKPDAKQPPNPGPAQAGVHASAMGTAITSDLMIAFGSAGQSPALERDMAAFQQRPMAGAHPEWVGLSGALGLVHPYDPERFPVHEKAAEDAIKGVWNLQDMTGEYGMFLYRAWHSSDYRGDGTWTLHRLYGAGHHYDAYLPWLYFARSGDPKLGEMGFASMRQLTDLGVIHYEDPRYKFRDFPGSQGKLVGSTYHCNGFVLWGGDHAIFGHLTSYGAMMLAHYLTGDLRFREVVVDEWQRTLLENTSHPQWANAARMNWGQNIPANNRDNNQAACELLDLYQLTYNARILPVLQLAMNSMEQNPTRWSRELANALDFRRTPKLRENLLKTAHNYRRDPAAGFDNDSGQPGAPGFRLALAASQDPAQGFERDSWYAFNVLKTAEWSKTFTDFNKSSGSACLIPDNFVEMPMVLWAGKKLLDKSPGDVPALVPQFLPIPGEGAEVKQSRAIVQESEDAEFKINVRGHIQSPDAWLKVLDGTGRVVHDAAIPAGPEHVVTIPKDEYKGEYVIFVTQKYNNDFVQLPLTTLGKEMYPLRWMKQSPRQSNYLFMGTPNRPGLATLEDKGSSAIFESRDRKTIVAQRSLAEAEKPLEAKFPSDGLWFRTVEGGDFLTEGEWMLSLSPERFFQPSEAALQLR